MREIHKQLPQYNYIYLGDTARAPYGNRSAEAIYEFVQQGVNFLFENGCGLVILACNTASSEALRRIQQEYLPRHYPKRRVLGIVIPAVEAAAAITRNNKIGVIATERTVASGAFVVEFKKLKPEAKIFQKACPLLVPIVEEGEEKSAAAGLILRDYLKPIMVKKIDTLILGCTHYGLLRGRIEKIVGNRITVMGEGKIVARKLKDYFRRHPEIERTLVQDSTVRFYTTDLTEKFRVFGSRFFGAPINPQKVRLD